MTAETDRSGVEPGPPDDRDVERAPSASEALPLEPRDEDEGSVRDLDVCPRCGAPLRGPTTLRCLRCGYDLKTMQVIEAPEEAEVPEAEAEPAGPPLVEAGRGGHRLPLALAAIAFAALVVGILSGAPGLFVEPLAVPDRLLAIVRYGGGILAGTACAIGGLSAAAWLYARPPGDLGLAASRMLATVAVGRLAVFVSLRWRGLEFAVEALIQSAVFLLLVVLLNRLTWREAATVLGLTICTVFLLYVGAHSVSWIL